MAKWHQAKLNAALKKACMLGNYKVAILIIRTGANNFEQCIKECGQQNRLNHILAFLRLCQAAFEDDQTAVDILLESNEDVIVNHPRYPSLVDYNTILLPLIDNGTLTIAEPLHIALKANHLSMAGKILARSCKRYSMGMVDWHGLELTELDTSWLKSQDFLDVHLLCLSFNALKMIPTQVCNFGTLVKLQVAFNKLTFVPAALFQNPCIENIDLSYNQISTLPEALLGKVSVSLQILTLSHNLLSRFPDYFIESSLRILDLSKNKFKEVPETVYSIKQLESLNMSYNTEIQFIPYELGGLRHLKVTSFDGLPYTFNVPNDSLMDFIRKRFKSMQTVSHYEVVVVGHPHHSQLLEDVSGAISDDSELKCGLLTFESPSHFLRLHHIFKLRNMVYVLLWDCGNRQEPNELHLVLRHLSIHAPDSPIIVAACWDMLDAQTEAELEVMINDSLWHDLRETVQLEHLILSNTGSDSPDQVQPYSLQALFLSIAKLSEGVKLTQFVPGSYYNCGEMLLKKRLEYRKEVKCPMLSEDDFWDLVSAMPSHDFTGRKELSMLVSYLHVKGVVMHIPGPTSSQSCYVFDREWLAYVLGNILSRRNTNLVQSFSAVVHQEVLIDLLGCPSLLMPLPNALQYMLNKEAVALALSSEKWLIPSMLSDTPEHTANIEPSQYGIRRQYTFNLTPPTFWCRLIAHLLMNMDKFVREVSIEGYKDNFDAFSSVKRRYSTLPKQGVVDWCYWKSGILCWQDACHLVYSIEFISVSTDPYQETIEIRVPNSVLGYRAMHQLSLTINSLLRNWYPEVWRSVEIWAPCSYCIHTGVQNVASISFLDCVLAMSKGVGVKCVQHPEKITSIAKIVPDLVQEDVQMDNFLPPGSVKFNVSDKSTCLSPPPSETVFKGSYNNQLVAVKPFPHRKMRGLSTNVKLVDQECPPLLQMWAEFEVLTHLQSAKCKFIIDMVGVCPDPLCLVFPFARWSSLEDLFHTKDITIPHMVRMRMVYQLSCALCTLQARKIIHRNICLANLLVYSLSVDDPVNIKLSGFSNACYSIFQGINVGQFGAFPAPEMLLATGGEYDERVDIFAFAFVAYEIITQTRMHMSSSVPLQEQSGMVRPCLKPIRVQAPYLVPLISKCWHPDRTKRPFASKVVQLLKHPLHVLVRDGHLIDKHHEFFAASARFTRLHNNFHSDLFVCSGQLMGTRTSCLSRESLPGLSFEVSKPLPTEFVICMGCIGSQLWISFYGKKVRVYSAVTMERIHEFSFKYHVLAIAVSPTSVYLGLETGVLQVYDVSESVPTEPHLTQIVDPGEEFKCIEAMDDSLICATKNTIFCLHPDTLAIEEKWNMDPQREIRCIVVSRCYRDKAEEEVEGNDLMWVAFRRWEKLLVMNPWTGQCYYAIDLSMVLDKPSKKAYVQSLRVVLDTVWVGLNTGHILVFSSNHKAPVLLTHLKVHREGVRQLLLLHPSYMGPSTVLSTSEIHQSLKDPHNSVLAEQQKPNLPESVLVVSFGTGLEYPLCSVDKHEGVTEGTQEEDVEVNRDGLFAIILEATSTSRMVQVERNSERSPLPYMEGYDEDEDGLYALPPDGLVLYDSPRRIVPSNIPRIDTWSASTAFSPVSSNLKAANVYDKIPPRSGVEFSMSGSETQPPTVPAPTTAPSSRRPPPLPPRHSPGPGPQQLQQPRTNGRSPQSPMSFVFGKQERGTGSPQPPPGHTESPATVDGRTEEERQEEEEDDNEQDAYSYLDPQLIQQYRSQSYTLPNYGSRLTTQAGD